ncbi:MAG: hypothetical protein CL569_15670 [Alphaproteobacteria bacterium]|nr:hypothetical protein [Alphaproteobacteria bacterium]|tara:strand:- start:170 stop:556 length:387 start_codon:yes stop_codon:yes gene_type:complete
MQTDAHTVEPPASTRGGLQLMARFGVSSLVIERHDERDELGLIAVSDIARDVIAKNRSLDRVDAYEVMTKPVVTLDADMDVKYAARLLSDLHLSRDLVVDHDRNLVGIATLRDMVLAYTDLGETEETT